MCANKVYHLESVVGAYGGGDLVSLCDCGWIGVGVMFYFSRMVHA